MAVNILGMTEEEFLRSTPKKLFKLAEIHQKVNSQSEEGNPAEEKQEMYIDQMW